MSYSLLHTIRRKSEFTISFTSLQKAVSAKKEKDIIWRSPTPSPHPQNFCWHFYMAQTNIIFPPVIKCILFKFKSLTSRSCKHTHKENSESICKPVTPQTPNTAVRSKTAASTKSNQTEKRTVSVSVSVYDSEKDLQQPLEKKKSSPELARMYYEPYLARLPQNAEVEK